MNGWFGYRLLAVTEVEAFDSVEVYGIVGTVLGLPRLAPNNGTQAVRERVLGR